MNNLAMVVSTKNRYFTSLPMLLTSVVTSSCIPSLLLIYDDNNDPMDLREYPMYLNLFKVLDIMGVEYRVVFGKKKGLTYNHLDSMDLIKREYSHIDMVLRVDDDVILDRNTIETLISGLKPEVGVVAPLLYMPDIFIQQKWKENVYTGEDYNEKIYNKLGEINCRDNIQWENPFINKRELEVEHINGSCFLYRLEAGLQMKDKYSCYLERLSPLCFREDTIWTQGIKRCGWNLKVLPKTWVWHCPLGGGEKNNLNAEKDEGIFQEFIPEIKFPSPEKKDMDKNKDKKENILVVNNGLGDHLVLKRILYRYIGRGGDIKFKLATCYPEVFKNFQIDQISIAESDKRLSKEEIDRCNLYKFMSDNNWERGIEEAYEKLFNRVISIFSNT